jgi:vacuolar-type H+-ATPase subunit H
MKQVVDKILQEEELSRARIDKARLEAETIIKKAKLEASLLIENSVSKGKVEAEQTKRDAEAKILSEKDHVINQSKEKASVLRKSKEKDISSSSQEIFSQIIKFKE